jgi:hypothetical protein
MEGGHMSEVNKDEEWKTEMNKWYSVRLEI